MLPGHGQSGGELAVLDVLADFVNIQGVAGVAHDSLGFIAGFQLCLARSAVKPAGGSQASSQCTMAACGLVCVSTNATAKPGGLQPAA